MSNRKKKKFPLKCYVICKIFYVSNINKIFIRTSTVQVPVIVKTVIILYRLIINFQRTVVNISEIINIAQNSELKFLASQKKFLKFTHLVSMNIHKENFSKTGQENSP